MKQCCVCRQRKTPDEFNKNRSTKDGLQAYCKSCHLENNRKWVAKNPEVRRATLRRQHVSQKLNGGRASKQASPEKKRAHHVVARAIKAGKLARGQSCWMCGCSDRRLEAHHKDYNRPLDVTWLCQPCHGKVHALLAVNA